MCLLEQSKVKLRKYIELIRNSMKPTIKTIECGNKDNGVAPIKVEIKKTKKSKKGCLIVTIVSCLLLMSAILVSGIYFGMLTHKHYKSYWATYRLGNGISVSEQITFTDTEEDITVPGKARVIFDFDNGLFVIKPSNKKVCYISQFNTTALAPPKQARKQCESKEEHNHIDERVTTKPEEIHARTTDLEAKLDILSPRAREMCSKCNIFWMEVGKDISTTYEGREKRSIYPAPALLGGFQFCASIKLHLESCFIFLMA